MVGKVAVLALFAMAAAGAYAGHRRGERIIFSSVRREYSVSPLLALALYVGIFVWTLVTWQT